MLAHIAATSCALVSLKDLYCSSVVLHKPNARANACTVQVNASARGSARLINLVPDTVLAVYGDASLQDIELTIRSANIQTIYLKDDYNILVKEAAREALAGHNGKTKTTRMCIQVLHALYPYNLTV
jgi:hypothetical protein